ncbi:uncharacterized protein BKA55DRAFT_559184 [Fusarium redolens]|uniref:Apple domain-containing protein n=1 Tax=Fusarium redolens TaxID=48865 RepID=A0A9P9HZ67_FUSRE|nr:uncharacterized protein BKA55DRAFT_559184 [Fusarium redolens]KAH7265552.1 hypothetical protein BKA55DRAFT_559184 [Fusarium redolens]
MPSTKSIAVVATLAAGVSANNCKPSPRPTTEMTTATPTSATSTITEAPSTTSTTTCPAYTLIEEPSEDINCNVRGDLKEGDSQVLESLYLEDCAQKCKEFDLFNCELISFEEPASPSEKGSCTLYPDNDFVPRARGGEVVYYDSRCFACYTRGGRGGRKLRGRIRRS